MKSPRLFSIVVPAHNEEKYLARTLRHLGKLDYPNYEVIVVENGSTDKTLEVAKKFGSKQIKIFSTKRKGVSHARNFGARKISPDAEWIVFLDADTLLLPSFLQELDHLLSVRRHRRCVVGTAAILPIERSKTAMAWFGIFNAAHQMSKTSFSIQMVRRDHFGLVRYDEHLSIGEDLKLIKELLEHGSFFFLNTQSVKTSTRRFRKVGWTTLAMNWTVSGALLSERMRRKIDYKVVR